MRLKGNILITGGCGFIGSCFIKYVLCKYDDIKIINLDNLTYAGNVNNLQSLKEDARYKFIKGNICDESLVKQIFAEEKINGVINFAAESHVDNSILTPKEFINTNIVGTFVLLYNAYNAWLSNNFQYKKEFANSVFYHVSTDEVYGDLGKTGCFTEEDKYKPNSPYSASKASSDLIVRSFNKTYGLNTIVSNCSNNYGPYQHDEKLIPTIIRNAIQGNRIPIYGNGENIRDWLHVEDHCKAIELLYNKADFGSYYNIGGGEEFSNMMIVTLICEKLDTIYPKKDKKSYKEQIFFVEDRHGHDFRYAIDPTKIQQELKFFPEKNFKNSLEALLQHYIARYQ